MTDELVQLATAVGAVGTLLTLVTGVYKIYERDKAQSAEIRAIQGEQTVMCYGILACLKGLKEQGCNGPVTDALNKLEKHLNKAAHDGLC